MQRVLSEIVEQFAPQALMDVFQSYGLRLTEGRSAQRPTLAAQFTRGEAIVAGLVGFTGRAMRGTLVVATTFEVISLSRPAELRSRELSQKSSSDWILVRDWAGELANQHLGRVKNHVHRFGVTFEVSPPTALSGPQLTFATPKGARTRSHVFANGDHKVWFCFDALYDDSALQVSGAHEVGAKEGDVILF